MNFRSESLLRLCKGQRCFLNLPGVCCGETDTVVPAHSNSSRHGKGAGIKAHDIFAVPACAKCHYELDQAARLSQSEKQLYFMWAWEAWLLEIFTTGLVTVAGKQAPRQRAHSRSPKILPRRMV